MAKSEIMDVGTAASAGVVVHRWWRSKEIWNYIASGLLIVLPLVANGLGTLGLDATTLLIYTVIVAALNHAAGVILKITSRGVIGSKTDVEIAKAAAPEETK